MSNLFCIIYQNVLDQYLGDDLDANLSVMYEYKNLAYACTSSFSIAMQVSRDWGQDAYTYRIQVDKALLFGLSWLAHPFLPRVVPRTLQFSTAPGSLVLSKSIDDLKDQVLVPVRVSLTGGSRLIRERTLYGCVPDFRTALIHHGPFMYIQHGMHVFAALRVHFQGTSVVFSSTFASYITLKRPGNYRTIRVSPVHWGQGVYVKGKTINTSFVLGYQPSAEEVFTGVVGKYIERNGPIHALEYVDCFHVLRNAESTMSILPVGSSSKSGFDVLYECYVPLGVAFDGPSVCIKPQDYPVCRMPRSLVTSLRGVETTCVYKVCVVTPEKGTFERRWFHPKSGDLSPFGNCSRAALPPLIFAGGCLGH